jgi:hypothetical protein
VCPNSSKRRATKWSGEIRSPTRPLGGGCTSSEDRRPSVREADCLVMSRQLPTRPYVEMSLLLLMKPPLSEQDLCEQQISTTPGHDVLALWAGGARLSADRKGKRRPHDVVIRALGTAARHYCADFTRISDVGAQSFGWSGTKAETKRRRKTLSMRAGCELALIPPLRTTADLARPAAPVSLTGL